MCLVVMGERKTCLSNSLAWPAPTRKEGSGPMPNMDLYHTPQIIGGVISGCGYDWHSSE